MFCTRLSISRKEIEIMIIGGRGNFLLVKWNFSSSRTVIFFFFLLFWRNSLFQRQRNSMIYVCNIGKREIDAYKNIKKTTGKQFTPRRK